MAPAYTFGKMTKKESVNRRLALYAEETQPLSDWYGVKGLLRVVNGSGEADEVFEKIRKIVDS